MFWITIIGTLEMETGFRIRPPKIVYPLLRIGFEAF